MKMATRKNVKNVEVEDQVEDEVPEGEDEDLGITYFVPLLPGKVLPQGLPYLVDEVFCMQIHEEGTYGQDDYQRYSYLQTFNTSKIVAKDRSGCLDEYEYPGDGDDIPNLTVLFNKIKKGIVK